MSRTMRNGAGSLHEVPAAASVYQDILPSDPVAIPFRGHEGIMVTYSIQRVMDLARRSRRLLKTLNAEADALIAGSLEEAEAFDSKWSPYRDEITRARAEAKAAGKPEPRTDRAREKQYRDEMRAIDERIADLDDEVARIKRRQALTVLADLVLDVAWPFAQPPGPEPGDVESFEVFPDVVLDWLVAEAGALALIKEQVRSPKSGARSELTTS